MLTMPEISVVVNRYIGVEGGYLGTFSYSSHAEFYPEYCDLDYDPYAIPTEVARTTREKFIHILSNAPPHHQAKILRGVLARFPVGGFPEDQQAAKAETAARIEAMIARLEGVAVPAPTLSTAKQVVEHALADAAAAIAQGRAVSAVDRLHTALHGYARELCGRHGVPLAPDASLPQAFSALRNAPVLGGADAEAFKILRTLGAVVESLNTLRNHGTPAHPNTLIDEADAHLAVNAARTLLAYLHARLG